MVSLFNGLKTKIMNLEVTETEVRLIKKLLKKELTHVKTEVKLVKIFDLQNKLNELTI
jgi:hypothetical protein